MAIKCQCFLKVKCIFSGLNLISPSVKKPFIFPHLQLKCAYHKGKFSIFITPMIHLNLCLSLSFEVSGPYISPAKGIRLSVGSGFVKRVCGVLHMDVGMCTMVNRLQKEPEVNWQFC